MSMMPEHSSAIDKFTSTDHEGKSIDKQSLLRPNHVVARVIAARAQTLSDQERQSLKALLTPQSMPVLKKLLPELTSIMDKANG